MILYYIKSVLIGIAIGCFDSIKGIIVMFSIDTQINNFYAGKAECNILDTDERLIDNIVCKNSFCIDLRESKILRQVVKCCTLNGVFTLVSIVMFEKLLLPFLNYLCILIGGENDSWNTIKFILTIIFNGSWVLPIFVLSKIVSGLWFQDIADEAYKFRKGRPILFSNISKFIADISFSLLVQLLFLVQTFFISFLPIHVGGLLCFMHMCLLYSLYSFEYKWINMGWELDKRLSYIESNWPYFIGFGIPLTILTSLPESLIVSGCLFSILFPVFIISGNEAKPLVGSVTKPLRLFTPVVGITNILFTNIFGASKFVERYVK